MRAFRSKARSVQDLPARASNDGGFTLVELMISIVVIMVAVVGAAQAQFSARNLLQQSRETKSALSDVQAAMEELLILPPDEIVDAAGPFAPNQAIAAWNDRHLRNERITVDFPGFVAGGPLPDPLTIRLTITWTGQRGDARTTSITTLKTR